MPVTLCGPPADVAEGNRLSDAIFSAHVLRSDLIEKPLLKMPDGFSSASSFGAVGDGKVDDSAALQHGLAVANRIWLEPSKVYRITKRLVLQDKCELLSDGTATVLMAHGEEGFSNRSSKDDATGLFSEKGTGLQVRGGDARLQHFFLVKEYEDDRYVIGIHVVAPARNVVINRLRLRGFSLAPGIIAVASVADVSITSSVIHAAYTQSKLEMFVPAAGEIQNNGHYQITGIVIDDQGPAGPSQNVRIENNVITDLWMKPVGRGDQTDGIYISENARSPHANAIVLRHNYVNHVAEGVDNYGHNVVIEENSIGGREVAIKLIHGARETLIQKNVICGSWSLCGIGLYPVEPDAKNPASLQVKRIQIIQNVFDMGRKPPGVLVNSDGIFPPVEIKVERNRFLVPSDVVAIQGACEELNNDRFDERLQPACGGLN